ncbi:MAG: transposase [Candidatus Binatus sp.]|uniref:transposase n=1 Tax=Candidatus Binatus sp. TaxID=2811406 RepID=UPI002723E441|nr:transposase [Candidatus Binatus sp.]MDO8433531.1 transposase [Candidatus Binatus sp.]
MESPSKKIRRSNPHLRLAGAAYFVTWRLRRGQGELQPPERTQVVLTLRHFKHDRYELLGYVVMDDHVHAILQPKGDEDLGKIIHSWKSFSANAFQRMFGRTGRIWQTSYYDRIVSPEGELTEKLTYIFNNPFKRWPEIKEYE